MGSRFGRFSSFIFQLLRVRRESIRNTGSTRATAKRPANRSTPSSFQEMANQTPFIDLFLFEKKRICKKLSASRYVDFSIFFNLNLFLQLLKQGRLETLFLKNEPTNLEERKSTPRTAQQTNRGNRSRVDSCGLRRIIRRKL